MRHKKKDYYENLIEKYIVDDKQFQKRVKTFFSDKTKTNEKITLVEYEKINT